MPSKAGIFYTHFDGGGSKVDPPPLIFIHGAGGTHLHWPPELRRAKGMEIYAIDLPGHGRSVGESETSIVGYANRLRGWMDALGLERVVLVGHSMGGAISLTISMLAPDHVAGMVLVGSGAKLRVHPQILALTESDSSYQQAAEFITAWAFSSHSSSRLRELALSRMIEVPAQVVHTDFLACDSFDIMDQLAEIEVATLVICGEQDRLTPVKYSRYLVDHLPEAKMELIERAGHMVMLEKPDAVLDPVRAFIKSL